MNKYKEMYKDLPREELIDILNERTEDIAQLKKQIKHLDKYKKYEETASEIFAIYQSFVNAGFEEKDAMKILLTTIQLSTPHLH